MARARAYPSPGRSVSSAGRIRASKLLKAAPSPSPSPSRSRPASPSPSPSRSRSAASPAARSTPSSESAAVSVGDLVDVESRTWPGINKPGGVGRVLAIHRHGSLATGFDVKYVLGGTEGDVGARHVRRHVDRPGRNGRGSPRGASARSQPSPPPKRRRRPSPGKPVRPPASASAPVVDLSMETSSSDEEARKGRIAAPKRRKKEDEDADGENRINLSDEATTDRREGQRRRRRDKRTRQASLSPVRPLGGGREGADRTAKDGAGVAAPFQVGQIVNVEDGNKAILYTAKILQVLENGSRYKIRWATQGYASVVEANRVHPILVDLTKDAPDGGRRRIMPRRAKAAPSEATTVAGHQLALLRLRAFSPPASLSEIDLTEAQTRRATENGGLYALRPGHVLGRVSASASASASSLPAGKLDIGITNNGISRQHLKIVSSTAGGDPERPGPDQPHVVVRRITNIQNQLTVRAYSGIGAAASFRDSKHVKKTDFILRVGDILLFDPWMKERRPQYYYRLVRIKTGGGPAASPAAPFLPSSEEETKMKAETKAKKNKKTEDQEADAAGRSSRPDADSHAANREEIQTELDCVDSLRSPPQAADADHEMDASAADGCIASISALLHSKESDSTGGFPASPVTETRPVDDELRPPAVGDRFRVFFEKCTNCFGVEEEGLYFGAATNVTQKIEKGTSEKYIVAIKFDDNSKGTYEYPGDDIDLLLDKNKISCSCSAVKAYDDPAIQGGGIDDVRDISESNLYPQKAFANGSKLCRKDAVFNADPTELLLGDLVDCRYQNGALNGAWYRGRVAAVEGLNGRTLISVAYNDGEIERSIPLEKGNVRFVSRGSDNFSWIIGAGYSENSSKGRRTTVRKGKIVGSVPGTNPSFSIEFSDGSSESQPCSEVVEKVFAAHIEHQLTEDRKNETKSSKVFSWPGCAAQTKSAIPVKSNSPEVKAGQEAEIGSGNILVVSEEAQDKSKTRFVSLNDDSLAPAEIDRLLNAPREFSQDTQESYSENPLEPGAKPRANDMHPSLANALWGALNTAEPHNGAIFLRHSAIFHRILPNASLSRNLLDYVKEGPRNEGVSFRDSNRTQLVHQVLNTCLGMSKRLDGSSFISDFAPSSWSDLEHCLSQPINGTKQLGTFASIKGSGSASIMRRLGQSLQLAACGVEGIQKIIQLELMDAMAQPTTISSRSLYASKSTIRAALDITARDALKCTVRIAAQCWIRHGHFIIGDGELTPVADCADEGWCALEARRCLNALGKVVSYFAWLYCAEEGIELENNDCSFIVKDAISTELESALKEDLCFCGVGNKKKPTAAARKKFAKRIKIWFLLSLDEVALPMRNNLTKLLGLIKDMKLSCPL